MKSFLVACTSSLVITSFASCATEPAVETIEQSSKDTFSGMVIKKLGLATGWSLLDYGCYCGLGNPDNVTWVDEVDDCCRLHDEKWLAASTKVEGCDCRTVEYEYRVDAKAVTCNAGQSACAMYCCDADKAFVECTATAGPLDPRNETIDRANVCAPLECRSDDDCEPGTYCDRGTCRMYCDPGTHGLAACDATPASL